MAAARDLNLSSVFVQIPRAELKAFEDFFYNSHHSIQGRIAGTSEVIVFHARGRATASQTLIGKLQSRRKNLDLSQITFSFSWDDNKYIFQGSIQENGPRQAILLLTTEIYRIQRRVTKRLKVPYDYYAIAKINSQNGKVVRVFGKLANISEQGLGLIFPNRSVLFNEGDVLKITLTMSQRPPEPLDVIVAHARWIEKAGTKKEDLNAGYMVGCKVSMKESSSFVARRMNSIVMDIFRDLFGEFSDRKKRN